MVAFRGTATATVILPPTPDALHDDSEVQLRSGGTNDDIIDGTQSESTS